VYNLHKKMSENMGFKQEGQFITDPAQVKKPPPQPNPEILKLQQADKEVQMKVQASGQEKMADLQVTKQIEEIKAQAQIAIAQMEIASKERIAQMEIQAKAQIEVFKAQQSLKDEADALDKEKLGLGYEKTVLALKQQMDSIAEKATKDKEAKIIADTTGAVAGDIQNTLGVVVGEIQKQAQTIDSLAQGLNQAAVQTAQLADNVVRIEKKSGEKKPRTHKVKKTADGYEITSV
jgi:X-X-X-Leu-X-X-Gly heptad repeat protein